MKLVHPRTGADIFSVRLLSPDSCLVIFGVVKLIYESRFGISVQVSKGSFLESLNVAVIYCLLAAWSLGAFSFFLTSDIYQQ